MLKIKAEATFTATVKIPHPGGEAAIKVHYRHMTADAFDAFVKQSREAGKSNAEVITQIVTNWEEVDVPFTPEAVADLCQQYHAAARVIVDTWITELTQAKRGN